MKQNTEEWMEWRRSRITASNVAAIMGEDPWKGPLDVYLEMVEGKVQEDNDRLRKGRELEPYARQLYEKHTNIAVEPLVVEHPDTPFMGASLDGISFDHSVVAEFKCPGLKAFENIKANGIPRYYWIQMQMQMFCVPEAKAGHFFAVLFHDGAIVDNYFEIVKRDPTFHVELFHACKDFWNDHILPKVPPEAKYVKMQDREYLEIEEALDKLMDIKRRLDAEESRLKEILIQKAAGRCVEGLLTRVNNFHRKGAIDEVKLKGMGLNVDELRKQGKDYPVVSFIRSKKADE